MNIAITGSSGFLGGYLIEELRSRKIKVDIFNHKKHSFFDIESLKDLVESKDVIIHLAGVNRDDDFRNIVKVNVLGTKNLLDATSRYCPNAKIIFSSSFQAYLKNSTYGVSKKAAEELIENYSNSFKTSVILRFSNLYGVGGKPFYNSVIATFVYQIKKNQPIVINGDGTQRRDYLHVTDAAKAIIDAIKYNSKKVEYFDICSGKLTSINEILDFLHIYSFKPIKIHYNKKAGAEDWNLRKSYSKAKKLLGWQPEVSIGDGLKELMNTN